MSKLRSIDPALVLSQKVPSSADVEVRVNAHLNAALIALEENRLSDAEKAFQEADLLNCRVRDLAHGQALLSYAQGNKTKAAYELFQELNTFADNDAARELLMQITTELGAQLPNDFQTRWRKPPTSFRRLGKKLRVGMVTPWNVKCGIEYYAKNVVRNVQHPDVEYVIFARHDSNLTEPDSGEVYRCWSSIIFSNDMLEQLYETIISKDIDILNFQVSYSFFFLPALNVLFRRLKEHNIKILLSFHSTEPAEVRNTPVSVELLRESAEYVDIALCYKEPDRVRLASVFGDKKVMRSNLPIAKFPATSASLRKKRREALGLEDSFVIGTHGFMLPNKGIELIVEALGILKQRGVGRVKFFSVTSLYERPELSQEVRSRCEALAERYQITDQIYMMDAYLEQKQIHQMLELCDLLAFCYTESKETASGAVRQSIQTGIPLATTPLAIFGDIAEFSHRLHNISPEALADEIEAHLKDPTRSGSLLARRALYLNNTSTQVLIDDLEQEMIRCTEERISVLPELPKISIVSPSFNCGAYIRDSIESVLAQGYPNFEHIIVDGASTDGTLEILKSYPHLRWVSEKDNGEAEALNKALRLATGELINWLNVDDDYFDNAVLHHVASEYKKNPDAGVIYGKGIVVNDKKELVMYRTPILPPVTVGSLMRWYTNLNLFQPAMFYTAEVVKKVGFFREDLFFSIDLEYWLRIAALGFRFHFTDRILANANLTRDGAKSGNSAESQHKNWQEIVTPFQKFLTRPERLNYWRDFYLYRIKNPLNYQEPITLPNESDELTGMVMAFLELFDVRNASAALNKLAQTSQPTPELYWLLAEIQHRAGAGPDSRETTKKGKDFQASAPTT